MSSKTLYFSAPFILVPEMQENAPKFSNFPGEHAPEPP